MGLVLLVAVVLGTGCDASTDLDPSITPPGISEVVPAEASVGTRVQIRGGGFIEEATVLIGDVQAESVEFVSENRIDATVPPGIVDNPPVSQEGQSVAVSVRNTEAKFTRLGEAFTLVRPEIEAINGTTSPSGATGSDVTIDGVAFSDRQGEGRVLFSDGSGGTVEASVASGNWRDTLITTTVPSGAGDGPVRVETVLGPSNEVTFDVQ